MLRRVAPALALLIVGVIGVFGLASRPATAAPTQHVDYVVVAGAAGLRWDDVNPTNTPTLWKLAQEGSVGALSVRSATNPTCPADGWLTLGAGNLAERSERQQPLVGGVCPAMQVPLTKPDSIGASVTDQPTVVQLNKKLPYGAQPGALAEAVRCTAAVGTGAAVAAARPYGRVDKYSEDLPTDFRAYLASCVLSVVDLGTLDAVDPVTRQAQAHAVDARLATVLANRPNKSLVLVAGLADTQAGTRLHVAIADGPGYQGGWLTSSAPPAPGTSNWPTWRPPCSTRSASRCPANSSPASRPPASPAGRVHSTRRCGYLPTPTGRPVRNAVWPPGSSPSSRSPSCCSSRRSYRCCVGRAGMSDCTTTFARCPAG